MTNFLSSLCILEIRPLSDVGSVKIFSRSVGRHFVLLAVFFALRKLFSFRRSHLLIVSLSVCATGVLFRKRSPVPVCSSAFDFFFNFYFKFLNCGWSQLIWALRYFCCCCYYYYLFFFNLWFFFFFFFETGFLCGFGTCPGTSSVDQAGLELTEIRLPLPPECWD